MNKQLNPRQIKTIQNFWNWFQDNEQAIYNACKLEINKDEVLFNLERNFNYVSKRIEHFIIANRNRGFIIMGLLRNSIIKEMLQVDEFAVKDRYAEDWTHIVKFLVCGKG